MTNKTKIIMAVLKELVQTPANYMLPDESLKGSCRMAVVPPATSSEVDLELQALEEKRLIIGTRNSITGTLAWRITDAGRSAYAELIN